jgi:hypothetical protein
MLPLATQSDETDQESIPDQHCHTRLPRLLEIPRVSQSTRFTRRSARGRLAFGASSASRANYRALASTLAV